VPPAFLAASVASTSLTTRALEYLRKRGSTWSAVLIMSTSAGVFSAMAFSIVSSDNETAPRFDGNFYNNLSNLMFYIAAFITLGLGPSSRQHFVAAVVLMFVAVVAGFLCVVVYPFSAGTALWANFASQLAQILSMVYLIE